MAYEATIAKSSRSRLDLGAAKEHFGVATLEPFMRPVTVETVSVRKRKPKPE